MRRGGVDQWWDGGRGTGLTRRSSSNNCGLKKHKRERERDHRYQCHIKCMCSSVIMVYFRRMKKATPKSYHQYHQYQRSKVRIQHLPFPKRVLWINGPINLYGCPKKVPTHSPNWDVSAHASQHVSFQDHRHPGLEFSKGIVTPSPRNRGPAALIYS